MKGILGYYSFDEKWSASRFLFFGLRGLEHRGQKGSGIITYDGHEFFSSHTEEIVELAYKNKDLESLAGHIGIGAVSSDLKDHSIQPISNDKLALCYDGEIYLDKQTMNDYSNNKDIAILEMLSKELERSDPEQAMSSLMEKIDGAYSLLALTKKGEMIAARDPRGITPLVLGGGGFEYAVIASESCACDVIGAEYARSIKPGEVVYIGPNSMRTCTVKPRKTAHCAYEYMYLSRPDSIINELPVLQVRRNIGIELAKEHPVTADVVIGVPDTGIPVAMSYSNVTGIDIDLGFFRTGRSIRTAIEPNYLERAAGVSLKLNPITAAIENKRVVLIDDSVARGATLRNIVLFMRRKGAKEIHVRIGAPRIIAQCPYGYMIPPEDELIGRHMSEEEIAKAIKSDSFAYLSLEGFKKALGIREDQLCLGCLTASYPDNFQEIRYKESDLDRLKEIP